MEQNPPPSKCLFPARTRTQAPPIVKPVFWTIVPQGQPGIWFLLFFSPSSDQPHLWNGLLNSLLNGLLDLGLLSIKSVLYTQPVSDLINISDKAIPRLQRKLNNSGLPTRKRKKKQKHSLWITGLLWPLLISWALDPTLPLALYCIVMLNCL